MADLTENYKGFELNKSEKETSTKGIRENANFKKLIDAVANLATLIQVQSSKGIDNINASDGRGGWRLTPMSEKDGVITYEKEDDYYTYLFRISSDGIHYKRTNKETGFGDGEFGFIDEKDAGGEPTGNKKFFVSTQTYGENFSVSKNMIQLSAGSRTHLTVKPGELSFVPLNDDASQNSHFRIDRNMFYLGFVNQKFRIQATDDRASFGDDRKYLIFDKDSLNLCANDSTNAAALGINNRWRTCILYNDRAGLFLSQGGGESFYPAGHSGACLYNGETNAVYMDNGGIKIADGSSCDRSSQSPDLIIDDTKKFTAGMSGIVVKDGDVQIIISDGPSSTPVARSVKSMISQLNEYASLQGQINALNIRLDELENSLGGKK
jgi:hypothetical protein